MLPIFGHLMASTLPGRRFVSAVLLAAYVVTAAGVSLPFGAKPQAGGEAFPCAACGCGCGSAEQCWRSCCCHSLAERVAWAREHKVRPPEHAIAAAQVAGLDLSWLGIKSQGKLEAFASSCCSRIATKDLPTCCQKRAAAACDHQEDSRRGDHIVAWRALACGGQSLNWLAAVPTLIVARPDFSHDLPLVAWLGPAVSETAELLPVIPELPPPERA